MKHEITKDELMAMKYASTEARRQNLPYKFMVSEGFGLHFELKRAHTLYFTNILKNDDVFDLFDDIDILIEEVSE